MGMGTCQRTTPLAGEFWLPYTSIISPPEIRFVRKKGMTNELIRRAKDPPVPDDHLMITWDGMELDLGEVEKNIAILKSRYIIKYIQPSKGH